jgi:hypothetical protein
MRVLFIWWISSDSIMKTIDMALKIRNFPPVTGRFALTDHHAGNSKSPGAVIRSTERKSCNERFGSKKPEGPSLNQSVDLNAGKRALRAAGFRTSAILMEYVKIYGVHSEHVTVLKLLSFLKVQEVSWTSTAKSQLFRPIQRGATYRDL